MPALPRLLTRLAHRIATHDASRPLWRHPATIAAAALALTLGAVPLLPDDDGRAGHDRPERRVHRRARHAAGRGEVTPEMRAEIERVVAEGAGLDRAQGRTATARAAVRCATFDGQRYCLGFGWTHQIARGPGRPDRDAAPPSARERTGDLDADGVLARDTPPQRARADGRRARRAHHGRAVRRQGVDAAPRDPGRRAAGRLRRAPPRGRRGRRRRPRRLRRVVPDEGQDPHQQGRPGAERDLVVRSGDDAGHRLELDRQAQEPGLLGPPPRHHAAPAPRSPTWSGWSTTRPPTTTRTTPAPTSCSTSATSPSSSGTA